MGRSIAIRLIESLRVVRVKALSWLAAFGTFAILSVACTSPRAAESDADYPHLTLIEFLTYQPELFIGTIEYVAEVPYKPSGPCANGVTPSNVGEVVIRPTRVLHGAGIGRLEPVRLNASFLDQSLVPGARVLAFGNRTCADDWRIWGEVALLDSLGEIHFRNGLTGKAREWIEVAGRPSRSRI